MYKTSKNHELLQVQSIAFARQSGLCPSNAGLWSAEQVYEPRTPLNREFTGWLRAMGGQTSPEVAMRYELVKNYNQFAVLPEFRPSNFVQLARGSLATAYLFELSGKKYVLRVLGGLERHNVCTTIDTYVWPLMIVRNEPYFEQIVAASFEENRCITEYVEGQPLCNLEAEELFAITTEQVLTALSTIDHARQIGVVIDFDASNWIYHMQNGFTVIDLDHPVDSHYHQHVIHTGFVRSLLQGSGIDIYEPPLPPDFLQGILHASVAVAEAVELHFAGRPALLNACIQEVALAQKEVLRQLNLITKISA